MSRIWSTLITVILIVLFVIGFQSMILNDPTIADTFEGLMGMLPFAEPFSKTICNVLGYQNGGALISPDGFVKDIAKLMIMSCILPALTAVYMYLFLRLPAGLVSIDDREDYMNGFGYRLKEMAIQVITAPVSAVLAGWFINWLMNWANVKFGYVGSILFGLLSMIIAMGVSAIPLVVVGVSVSVALLWRLLVTMLGGMLNVLVTTIFSIAIYYAILNEATSDVIGLIFGLLIALVLLDILIQWVQCLLGARSLR